VQETTVVLGVEDPPLQEEILHFLERLPHVRVVAVSPAATELARRIGETKPDAAVVSPGMLADAADLDGSIVVVGDRETTSTLRVALRAGARGFYTCGRTSVRPLLGIQAERDALARQGRLNP
jgi:DNA-binding NarL/FixJ family response regulator